MRFFPHSLTLSLFASLYCFASDANSTIQTLEPITVTTATKSEKNIDGVAASIEVITQEEIAKMGAASLKEIFNQTPGVNIQYGTFPSASSKSKGSITLRGMGAKGTLMLIDGRRLSGEVSNPYDLDRIPASEIERIEIVKGPMSTLYGADAMGGVVNIITKKITSKPAINFGVRYGQNGEGQDKSTALNFSVSDTIDKFGYSFYINHLSTTPYTQTEVADVYAKTPTTTVKPSVHPNPQLRANLKDSYNTDITYKEESDILTYGGRVEYDFTDALKLGFDINVFDEERAGTYIGYFHPTRFGVSPNFVPAYNVPVDSKDNNNRIDISTDLTYKITQNLNFDLKAYRSYYEKRNTTTAKYFTDMGYATQAESAQNGLDADVEIRSVESIIHYAPFDNHFITLGGEMRSEDRDSTAFTLTNTMSRKSVDYKSLYAQDEWEITDDLNVVAGVRYDDMSNSDSEATYKVGAIKNFSPPLNVRANYSQGYRVPDIRELYILKNTPTGAVRGADVIDASVGKTTAYNLKPETTDAFELGFGGLIAGATYDLALFYNSIENMIVDVNKGSYYTSENLNDAQTYGSEFGLSLPFGDQVRTAFNWSELRTKNEVTGKKLEFNPDRTLSVRFEYEPIKALNTSLMAKYIGDQYYQKTLNRGAPTQTIIDATADSYTTVDWNIGYTITKTTSLYGGIYNMLDEKIDDVLGSSSGRTYFAGIKISL